MLWYLQENKWNNEKISICRKNCCRTGFIIAYFATISNDCYLNVFFKKRSLYVSLSILVAYSILSAFILCM